MNLPVIAVAIDFKSLTPFIIQTGLFVAQKIYNPCKIILFHVIEYFFSPRGYVLTYLEKEKKLIEAQLKSFISSFEDNGIKVETKVILGNFWEALNEFIEKVKPELLILGYMPHKLKIPTAEKMLERLDVSFLVVKEKPLIKLNTIGCLIDFSEISEKCLKTALFFSEKNPSKIVCLNIIPYIGSFLSLEIRERVIQEEKEKREKAWQTLQNIFEFYKLKNKIEIHFEISTGERLECLNTFIKKYEPDLLILGKRGKVVKSGLGSFSKEVIRKIELPILLIN